MPRFIATTPSRAEDLIHEARAQELISVLSNIAVSALDDCQSGADTAAVVYEQLHRLGITVP